MRTGQEKHRRVVRMGMPQRRNVGRYLRDYCDTKYPGGQGMSRLSEKLRVSLSIVSLWCSGHRQIPVGRAIQLVHATDGGLSIKKLRPDLDWELLRYYGNS